MNNTIKCKYCGREQEISDLIQHQITEEALIAEREKEEKEKLQLRKQVEEETTNKVKLDFETNIKILKQSSEEEKERSKKLQEQLLDLVKKLQKAEQDKADAELNMQKKLLEGQEKVRQDERKKLEEDHRLKDAEKDKKLQDALRVNDELRRKLEQGSQQAQGEVMELELEEILRKKFPNDILSEVKKGERGADVLHEVIDKQGRKCGLILWESKNAQWQEIWVNKLRENQRAARAQQAVLVVANPPDNISTFIYREGVWIVVRKLASDLALALRYDLIRVQYEKLANVGKNEKMEVLYQYIRSTEFIHRIEAIMDYFKNRQDDLEKERRYFTTKWAKQEKELSSMRDNTYGMYGELQAVTGKELPDIKLLNSSEDEVINEEPR